MIDVLPITPSIGATVRGVDLRAELSAETVAELRTAWLEHVPATGGDTMFCNLCAAYEALCDQFTRFLEPSSATAPPGDLTATAPRSRVRGPTRGRRQQRCGSARW